MHNLVTFLQDFFQIQMLRTEVARPLLVFAVNIINGHYNNKKVDTDLQTIINTLSYKSFGSINKHLVILYRICENTSQRS